MWIEARGNVVRTENRDLRGLAQSLTTHHENVSKGNRKDRCRAVGCRGNGPNLGFAAIKRRMSRQKWREMRLHRNRANARSTATVRNAECLVQVEMRDIRTEFSRFREPHLSIQ